MGLPASNGRSPTEASCRGIYPGHPLGCHLSFFCLAALRQPDSLAAKVGGNAVLRPDWWLATTAGLSNPFQIHPMIRILIAIAAPALALAASSCCCTSDSKPPRLRPLPQFQEIGSAPAETPVIYDGK